MKAAKIGVILRNRYRRLIKVYRLLKLEFIVLILLGGAVIVYAYVGDLSPTQVNVSAPVELDGS
ncbi:MAG: hypothetical protein F4103_04420 [Boseongicola sp. SB0673_bin_14]|nr:hypothetical protein [Boseongicola sp. SB0673_bin_14]